MMSYRPSPVYAGDPGILSFVGKAIGTVARGALGFATGGIGGAVGAIAGSARPGGAPVISGFQATGPRINLGGGGASFQGPSLGFASGGGGGAGLTKDGRPRRIRKDGKPYKRPSMNVLNHHAASRAIRRIRGARHILLSIEREMPHRTVRAHRGSPGVITRSEAARALRA